MLCTNVSIVFVKLLIGFHVWFVHQVFSPRPEAHCSHQKERDEAALCIGSSILGIVPVSLVTEFTSAPHLHCYSGWDSATLGSQLSEIQPSQGKGGLRAATAIGDILTSASATAARHVATSKSFIDALPKDCNRWRCWHFWFSQFSCYVWYLPK